MSLSSKPKGAKKLAVALTECSVLAGAYGACMNRVFAGVQQASCAAEFEAFKACFTKSVSAEA
ncbi:hypothetical protein BC831DRAFT_516839 [Entophlyctis helioformis]|nr:hypothetical protein BC831DRAFT_516839 [Entophlyctis helioformis]